jgi:phosphoglycolate phosphatase-like HAD superfamily hydrolase
VSRAYDLILFDLDGTLIETAPEIADAVNDTLDDFNRPRVTQRQVNDWIGHGTRELLIQALAFCDHTSADAVRASVHFPRIEAAFGIHYQKRCGTRSHLYPRVRDTLQALRAAGVKLVVVTNKEGRYTQTVLDAHQLAPLFDRGRVVDRRGDRAQRGRRRLGAALWLQHGRADRGLQARPRDRRFLGASGLTQLPVQKPVARGDRAGFIGC